MEVIISITIAYIVSGLAYALQSFGVEFYERPHLARKQPILYIILHTLIWPIMKIVNIYRSVPLLGRSIAFGVMSSGVQITWMAGFSWCCIMLIFNFFGHGLIQLVIAIILIPFGLMLFTPIATILAMPITMILGLIIEIFFPLKNR